MSTFIPKFVRATIIKKIIDETLGIGIGIASKGQALVVSKISKNSPFVNKELHKSDRHGRSGPSTGRNKWALRLFERPYEATQILRESVVITAATKVFPSAYFKWFYLQINNPKTLATAIRLERSLRGNLVPAKTISTQMESWQSRP
jgi:hypothetical protein